MIMWTVDIWALNEDCLKSQQTEKYKTISLFVTNVASSSSLLPRQGNHGEEKEVQFNDCLSFCLSVLAEE